MSKEVKYDVDGSEVTLSFDIIRKYLVTGDAQVTDQELMMFLQLCKFQKLNPFIRDAYIIKYSPHLPATLAVGKDVFLKRASKFPTFKGFKAGIVTKKTNGDVVEKEGAIVDEDEKVIGGWCSVFKEGCCPTTIKVSFAEYAGRKKGGELNKMWGGKPATMIRKVSIAQALREAYPDDFRGLYIEEEMQGNNNQAQSNNKDKTEKLRKILKVPAHSESYIIPETYEAPIEIPVIKPTNVPPINVESNSDDVVITAQESVTEDRSDFVEEYDDTAPY